MYEFVSFVWVTGLESIIFLVCYAHVFCVHSPLFYMENGTATCSNMKLGFWTPEVHTNMYWTHHCYLSSADRTWSAFSHSSGDDEMNERERDAEGGIQPQAEGDHKVCQEENKDEHIHLPE